VPTWLGFLLVVLAVASRPIEVRLWRAGRISDRTVTILLLGRFPVVVGVAALATDGFTILTAVLVAISLVPSALFYGWMLGFLRGQRAESGAVPRDIRPR
jgi:hypothetical protein